MNPTRPSARLATGLLIAALTSAAHAETIDETFHHRFDVDADTRLVLEHGDGDVVIEAWEQDAIEVDVTYRAELTRIGLGGRASFDVRFDERGDTRYVIGKEKRRGGFGFFTAERHEHVYRIKAPRHVVLGLEGDDGDIDIEGWHGDITIELDDGDIDLRDIEAAQTRIVLQDGDVTIDGLRGELLVKGDDGDVTLRNCDSERVDIEVEDGDVDVDQCLGRIAVSTDDGRVRLDRVQAASLDIETSDGDVEAELLGYDPHDVRVITDDGSVELRLADGMSTAFTILMDDGDVDVDLRGAELDRRDHRVEGHVGTGDAGGAIRVETNDGDVILRRAR